MSDKKQARIVELQRQLKVAKDALTQIASGHQEFRAPQIAAVALDAMWPLEPKQPLQHLVGHERRGR